MWLEPRWERPLALQGARGNAPRTVESWTTSTAFRQWQTCRSHWTHFQGEPWIQGRWLLMSFATCCSVHVVCKRTAACVLGTGLVAAICLATACLPHRIKYHALQHHICCSLRSCAQVGLSGGPKYAPNFWARNWGLRGEPTLFGLTFSGANFVPRIWARFWDRTQVNKR